MNKYIFSASRYFWYNLFFATILFYSCKYSYLPKHQDIEQIEYSQMNPPPHYGAIGVKACNFFCDTPLSYYTGKEERRCCYSIYTGNDTIDEIMKGLYKITFKPLPDDWYYNLQKDNRYKSKVERCMSNYNLAWFYPPALREIVKSNDSTQIFNFSERLIFYKKNKTNDTLVIANHFERCRRCSRYGYKAIVSLNNRLYEVDNEIRYRMFDNLIKYEKQKKKSATPDSLKHYEEILGFDSIPEVDSIFGEPDVRVKPTLRDKIAIQIYVVKQFRDKYCPCFLRKCNDY